MLSSPPQIEGALDHAGRRLVAFAAAVASAVAAAPAAPLALAAAGVAELGGHVAHGGLRVARLPFGRRRRARSRARPPDPLMGTGTCRKRERKVDYKKGS